MPLFFFDIHEGEACFRDAFGTDLESVDEAADQAAALLPDVLRDALPGRASHDVAAFVRDESDAVVYRAALLFRGQRMAGTETERRPGEGEDVVARSRATRMEAHRVSIRLRESVEDLLSVMQDAMRAAAEIEAGLGLGRGSR